VSSKKNKKRDPYGKREASKYTHPVPSREFIMEYLEDIGEPLAFNALLTAFNLEKSEEKEGLRRRLKAMCRDGQLICNRRQKFALVEAMDLVSGYVQGHRDGYGFLIPDDDGPDIFLPAREMRNVFPLDRVLVRVVSGERQRREGIIVEILESNTRTIVGRFYKEGGVAFVDPDDKNIAQDIIIPPGEQNRAKKGEYVLVEILSQPHRRHQPTGRIIEILGDKLTPGMEVELSIRSHDIPFKWPKTVKQQANKFSRQIKKSELRGRKDLRH